MGFAGLGVTYESIPWNTLDYITLLVSIMLAVFVAYIIYESCISRRAKTNSDGLNDGYRALPGDPVTRNSGGLRLGGGLRNGSQYSSYNSGSDQSSSPYARGASRGAGNLTQNSSTSNV